MQPKIPEKPRLHCRKLMFQNIIHRSHKSRAVTRPKIEVGQYALGELTKKIGDRLRDGKMRRLWSKAINEGRKE